MAEQVHSLFQKVFRRGGSAGHAERVIGAPVVLGELGKVADQNRLCSPCLRSLHQTLAIGAVLGAQDNHTVTVMCELLDCSLAVAGRIADIRMGRTDKLGISRA